MARFVLPIAAVLVAAVLAVAPRDASRANAALPAPPSSLRALAPSPLPPRPAPPPPSRAEREHAAVARAMKRFPFVSAGGARGRTVALTFDDGPSPYTQSLVRVLRRRRVSATFFQVGQMVAAWPGAARLVRRAGFPVGDHTDGHPPLATLGAGAQRSQVISTVWTLRRIDRVRRRPNLFRPPYASFDRDTLRVARQQRMLTVLWDVDSADYTLPGTAQIVRNVVSRVRPGSIVLMHDGGGPRSQTVAAVPAIVRALRRRGYRFVTVPQMMRIAPPHGRQKLPPGAGPG